MNETQEVPDQQEARFEISAATSIRERELGARWASDEHIDVADVLWPELDDIADTASSAVIFLVGHEGRWPQVETLSYVNSSLTKPL